MRTIVKNKAKIKASSHFLAPVGASKLSPTGIVYPGQLVTETYGQGKQSMWDWWRAYHIMKAIIGIDESFQEVTENFGQCLAEGTAGHHQKFSGIHRRGASSQKRHRRDGQLSRIQQSRCGGCRCTVAVSQRAIN